MEHSSADLRKKFLEYFKKEGHIVVPSASLIPKDDSSVLFTTAGMQQFKPYYTNPEIAPATRITTSQLCLRTSDIDEVGDESHLTLFEMLGNFSFGYPSMNNSYFKEEAIKLAWKFLTLGLGIEKARISCTYFSGEDDIAGDEESKELLKNITGFSEDKILGTGKSETFWGPTGEEGPCGPTVEFYVDGIEIWNLVFNQYYYKDRSYSSSEFQGVDTGMGFERLLTVINKDSSNVYQTDLFDQAHKKLDELSSKEDAKAERIILDHIRAAVFLINDGIVPSNKDHGYVLRRLIRRAIVKAHQIGILENFTIKIAEQYFDLYNGTYDLKIDLIKTELEKEETKFRKTLKDGLRLIDSYKEIDGKILFDLYQSYGLPFEITLEEAENRNIVVNNRAIEQSSNLLRSHQELSRTASAGMFKGGLAGESEKIIRYHTATHLLLAALREVLGSEVAQKGANITEERIRFDFSYPEKVVEDKIAEIEKIVNEKIKEDLPVIMEEMTVSEAKKSGATGEFESKYGDKVKVYTIGPSTPGGRSGSREFFSREICGGPHVTHTGELGHFKIIKEESSSAGIRRIKAILE